MSEWGGISAGFYLKDAENRRLLYKRILGEMEDRSGPTGSEEGPLVLNHKASKRLGLERPWVSVHGRLRDVGDQESSLMVVAWFQKLASIYCQNGDTAELEWELDFGPRYRYEWKDGKLVKLLGVLDQ